MFKSERELSTICSSQSANLQSAICNPQSERGIALVVALIIMVAIMGLGSAYLLLTISESRRAKVDEYYLRGLHRADGGIQQGIWRYEDVDAFKNAVKNDGDSWFVITLPDGGVDTVVVTK